MWLSQIEALFDIWVTDVDTPSYVSRSIADVLLLRRKRNASTGLLLRSIVPPFHHLL